MSNFDLWLTQFNYLYETIPSILSKSTLLPGMPKTDPMPDQSATHCNSSSKLRKAGVTIACLIGATSFGLIALSLPFVLPALRKYCLPYVPATPVQIEKVLLHVKDRTGKVVDLGSGDGRVVVGAFVLQLHLLPS